MKKHRPRNVLLILLLISVLFPACAKKMSLEEAKQVTVTMEGRSFTPPPRRIDDILAFLDQPGGPESAAIEKLKARAAESPPENADNSALANFYFRRGEAASLLGLFKQSDEDFRTALHYAEKANTKPPRLLAKLGVSEFISGNFKHGIELLEQSLKIQEHPSTCTQLVKLYARVGDLESAERYKRRGVHLCNQLKERQGWGVWPELFAAQMRAYVLEAQGRFAEAEKYYRKNQRTLSASIREQYPIVSLVNGIYLARNLKRQGHLLEAELEARQALKDVVGYGGKESEAVGGTIGDLGDILQRQGRLKESEKLMRTGIRIVEKSDISADSYIAGQNRIWLGNVLTDKGDFVAAMEQYDIARENLRDNQYLYEGFFARNPNLMISLLKTDRTKEAVELINAVYDAYSNSFGNEHYFTAEVLGIRGVANFMTKNRKQSFDDFSRAIPVLQEQIGSEKVDLSQRRRLKIIIETYMALLNQIYRNGLEQDFGIHAAEEAFRLAETLHGHSVQSAVAASSARAAVVDRDLADLVRREQDALKQINVLQATLTDSLAAPKSQQLSAVVEKLRSEIDALSKARMALLDEIQRRFPKYSEFTNPKPVTFSQVQNHLQPGEALISIYPAESDTYVWAIPHTGKMEFSSVPYGEKELSRAVTRLRKALDPEPETFGDIPEFDVQQAYDLYDLMLKPVASGWKGASDVLVIAHGSLGQLPFSLLPTAPVTFAGEKSELFGKYRRVPWLVREVSICRLPSASSLMTLRTIPPGDPNRKAFVGFADPIFNRVQLAQSDTKEAEQSVRLASRGGKLQVRGIRVCDKGSLDNEMITSGHLDLLHRLPGTAAEIQSIASTLGADPTQDIFLGKKASELQVKTMDLSNRKVIAFATHALVPGDLDGLLQPALALSSPSITGDSEDGLLTMGEILTLRLNADWVVLSACNTGAAEGAGAEAVSGLGRAFFYAGTRALLVSMWPVETTSARELTTGLFKHQKENPQLSRARALRKSMIELIDGPGLKDD
ncbi:MAG: CHAT domain-containing protein, partial [Syntrophobacterales bacterium]